MSDRGVECADAGGGVVNQVRAVSLRRVAFEPRVGLRVPTQRVGAQRGGVEGVWRDGNVDEFV